MFRAYQRWLAALTTSVAVAAAGVGASLVEQAAIPARIVSTSPSITETLFALGLGDRVVGVSQFCRVPAEVASLPKVGAFLRPDAELIAGLRPDLVIVHKTSNAIDRQLQAMKLRFIVVDRGSLESIWTSIRQIGAAAGVASRASALIGGVQHRLQAMQRSATTQAKPRVLFIIGRRPGALADLVAVGPGSYINDLMTIAGATNVMNLRGQPEYPRISMETVLRLDPDVIVDTVDMGETDAERAAQSAANQRLWAAYPMLRAVRTKRLHTATTDALVVPGPRVVEAARWVSDIVRAQEPK